MESKGRRCLAFVLSALKPPATYSGLAIAAHVCHTWSSSSAFLLLVLVFALLSMYSFCCCSRRHRHGSSGSAPAYASVLGHFATAVLTYIIKLLPVVSAGLSIGFLTLSCAFGFCLMRMIASDPGRMDYSCLDKEGGVSKGQTNENYISSSNKSCAGDSLERCHFDVKPYDACWRGKYCHYCHAFIERYDHHCAAVQNCIGLKNHGFFLLFLVTSCLTEILYVVCCTLYLKVAIGPPAENHMKDGDGMPFDDMLYIAWVVFSREAWVLSITSFVAFQIVWQVPFLIFQIYLVTINLTTDEWVNWEENPRFYKEAVTSPGLSHQSKVFVNPYDKGFLKNFKALLQEWK